MNSDVLQVTRTGAWATVTLARPSVRNAFNAELIAALGETFASLGHDTAVRAIVLAGAGATFCGGADINWMRASLDLTEEENLRDADAMARMYRAIDRCAKPVIARVQGGALGGGAGLCAVADIVVAASDAVFGFTEVKLGLLPGVISPFVVAKIGVSHARALFVTGERFGAEQARAIGLVHHVVPVAELDATIAAILREISSASPAAIAAAKAIVPAVALAAEGEAHRLTVRAIAHQRISPDGQEGLRAFLDRRPPAWAEAAR